MFAHGCFCANFFSWQHLTDFGVGCNSNNTNNNHKLNWKTFFGTNAIEKKVAQNQCFIVVVVVGRYTANTINCQLQRGVWVFCTSVYSVAEAKWLPEVEVLFAIGHMCDLPLCVYIYRCVLYVLQLWNRLLCWHKICSVVSYEYVKLPRLLTKALSARTSAHMNTYIILHMYVY